MKQQVQKLIQNEILMTEDHGLNSCNYWRSRRPKKKKERESDVRQTIVLFLFVSIMKPNTTLKYAWSFCE